jgi:predicted HTH transcriptional regulator
MMKKYKVFVSGVQRELKKERRAVKDFILGNPLLKEYFNVFLFEDLPAKSRSAQQAYLDEVRKSDIYLGIFGGEYGKIGKDNLSATEKEFREAHQRSKTILIYVKDEKSTKRHKRMNDLIKEAADESAGYIYKEFNTIQELNNSVHESLVDFLRDEGIVGKAIFDGAICKSTSLDDIDGSKIRWFLDRAKRRRKYPLDVDTPIIEALTHLNLINRDKLKNATILCFGKNPHKFHLQAEVKCIQFPGIEIEKPFSSYHIYTDNLFEQIDKAVAFVLDAIRLPVIQQTGTAAVRRPLEIPEFVIQEAIVNAVAHRNYNNTAGVQIMVFVDRVEVWNPGKLPAQITIDELKKPHTSHPNNPLLAEVLYLADYIQKAGSGTLEMIKQCKKSGLPEPEFKQLRSEFRSIISRDIYTENVLKKLGLGDRQITAVMYVKQKSKIRNKEYQKLCGVKKRQATDDLKELENKNILQRVGKTGKGTYYILKGRQRGETGIKGAPKGRKGSKD